MKLKTKNTIFASVLSAVSITASASGPLVSGPIESMDTARHTVTVLGQKMAVPPSIALSSGDRVTVFGQRATDGVIKISAVQSEHSYVAGADAVLVTGVVTSVDSSVGQLTIDGAAVDYTGLLSSSTFETPSVGDSVEVSGVQPAPSGLILASTLKDFRYAGTSTDDRSDGVVVGGIRSDGVVVGGIRSDGVVVGGIRSDGVVVGGVRSDGVVVGGVRSDGVVVGGIRSSGVVVGGVRSSGVVVGGVRSDGVVVGGVRSSGVVVGGIRSDGVVVGGVRSDGVVVGGIRSNGVVVGGARSD